MSAKTKFIPRKEVRAGYEAQLKRLLGADWIKRHPDILDAWFQAPITGGMFKAGVRFAQRKRA